MTISSDTTNNAAITSTPLPTTAVWQLYGTVGCHLCEQAEQLLIQVQAVQEIHWQNVDIADLPEPIMQQFADKIPILMTPNQTLYYPFSLMDILAIAND